MSDKLSLTDDAQFYSELMRAYFNSTQDAIFVLCDEMKFLTCNKTTEYWLGQTEHELTLHNKRIPFTQLLGKKLNNTKFTKLFYSTLQGHSSSLEMQINPLRGKQRWIEINLSRVDVENGDMVIAVARDITERKKHLATIEYQSYHDRLTSLPNRTFIIEYLKEYQNIFDKQSQKLVLLVLNIDDFKEINKSLGHKFGDRVLQEVAKRLGRLSGTTSSELVARYSDDKFIIALPNTELPQSWITAQMIRQIISQSILIEEKKISLDCTIGIASLPTHTDNSSQLIQLAEAAMYSAKSQKLGISTYNPELLDSSADRLQLASDLREALKKGQINVHYQPIINMRTKSLHVETLVRWYHPHRGMLSPDVFIPLAEETGNIHKLTSRVLEVALHDCAAALNQNTIESISINISPYCLINPKLPVEINACLKKYAIKPESIMLEITESAMMSDLPAAQETIELLHDQGMAFSIDDFGTGYSSLSKLKYMPLSELKIDKLFISDINQCENDAAITNAAIQMAHGLGLSVVAEGIESEEIWNRLRQMGCDYGQGFWIAKPMEINKLRLWINRYHTVPKSSSENVLLK